MRRLVTSAGCVSIQCLGLGLRNGTLIVVSFTMSTYDFEPLGGTGSGM